MNQINLDSAEMKDFLHHMIKNNRFIQEKGKTPVSTEIIGDSGLGKTSIALQLAEQYNLDFVKLNLAQIEELGDLVGFPVRQFQLSKVGATKIKMKKVLDADGKSSFVKQEVTDDTKVWIDENAVTEYTKQGYSFTGKKRMSYCPPEWIADKTKGGILILDDWNRADIRFIQAVMELVDRQEYISWKLPKDWHIILTANPDDGEYLVNSIDVAQRTRFVSTGLKWSHERWAEWAETQGIDTRCINFMLMHPEVVNERVNPRSVTTFFNCISSFDEFIDKLPMIQMIGEGSVGPEVATLFTQFINNRLDKLVNPRDILFDDDDLKITNSIINSTGQGDDFRGDIASVITTRIINFTLHFAETNSISPNIINRLRLLINDDRLFTDDLKYIIVRRLLNGNKLKFQKMLTDPKVQEMTLK
jgi:hypothetical protein